MNEVVVKLSRKVTPWPLSIEYPEQQANASRKIWVYGLLTLLFHLILFFMVSDFVFKKQDYSPAKPFEVILVPRVEEMRFVETNPCVAENISDHTSNYAARSQQAAQEIATNGHSELPYITGEELNSQAIVKSETLEDSPPSPPSPMMESPSSLSNPAIEKTAQTPKEAIEHGQKVADFKENKPQVLEGSGVNIKQITEKAEAQPRPTLSSQEPSIFAEAQASPRPRPSLKKLGIPAPLMDSPSGSAPLGTIAVDATMNQFGKYQQQMLEAIVYQWHLLAGRISFSSQDMASRVVVTFNLDKDGNVHDVNVSTSSASSVASLICKDAIESRAPYGPWPHEMIKVLGNMHFIQFTFLYY